MQTVNFDTLRNPDARWHGACCLVDGPDSNGSDVSHAIFVDRVYLSGEVLAAARYTTAARLDPKARQQKRESQPLHR